MKSVIKTTLRQSTGRCASEAAADVRYILNMNIMDETSNLWVTGFNEIGEQVLGMSADALTQLKVGATVRRRADDRTTTSPRRCASSTARARNSLRSR